MNNYLLPENDDLPARPSGQWAAEKLYYVKTYVDIFEISMRDKPWRRRNYIDLFAGPGKCVVEETGEHFLGSPLLALTTEHPFTDYFFVDLRSENITALEKRCAATGTPSKIHYIVGDSNNQVNQIVEYINQIDKFYIKGLWPSLNLAFLDPEGLELEWKTVEALTKVNKMDLIIHYSQHGLSRNLDLCYTVEGETIIDRFFGDRAWWQIFEPWRAKSNRKGMHRELIDYYKSKLQNLGYQEIRNEDETGIEPLMRTSKQAPLYRLLFASKHPLGHNFWKSVTRKDLYGQKRLF
jgi:three-Cys-motif partner protein